MNKHACDYAGPDDVCHICGADRAAEPGSVDALASALTEVRRGLYSQSGMLDQICCTMEVGPHGFALRSVIEGGLPEIIHLADRALKGAGLEVDLDDLSRCMDRGAEVARETIAEDAKQSGVGERVTALKVAGYHMEDIAHGLRSGELSADDAAKLLDEEAKAARRLVDEAMARIEETPEPSVGVVSEGDPNAS